MIGTNRQPAVFLDRDGTLIEDRGHLSRPDEVVFLPGTFEALRRLQDQFLFFIVTNQSGVGKGIVTGEQVACVNSHVVSCLAAEGFRITTTYVCPHTRDNACLCIKPNPHFLRQAAEHFGVDLRRSFVVGDHPHDVELARRAGARGVYVLTGHGRKHLGELPPGEVVMLDLPAAAAWILAQSMPDVGSQTSQEFQRHPPASGGCRVR